MKLKSSSNINIAKSVMHTANTLLQPLDYQKWKDFIECHNDYFIWNEHTEKGKNRLQNIQNVPEDFKKRVLATLNKGVCLAEYNKASGNYNISVTFYEELNWITIQFSRTPKPEDLKIFIEMANHLDALLLVDRTTIVNEETLKNLS